MLYNIENGYSEKELQILNWCIILSHTQGLYGRLLNELKDNKEALEYLAEQNFDSMLDFAMFIEC